MSAWSDYYADKPRTHYVYRVFDASGTPLYVGCSNDVRRRLGEHRRQSCWWPFAAQFVVDSEPQPDAIAWTAERREIRRLKPVFNLGANHEHYRYREYLAAFYAAA